MSEHSASIVRGRSITGRRRYRIPTQKAPATLCRYGRGDYAGMVLLLDLSGTRKWWENANKRS